MSFDPEPVKKWFGYNRKERRASFILITLVTLVLAARMFVPASDMKLSDVTMQFLSGAATDTFSNGASFLFDPNKSSYDTLLLAGLEETEARTLMNYRSKGGRFRYPADIKKLYGIDSAEAARIIPLIRIQQDSANSLRYRKKGPVELNSCDSAMLEKLPGIGPVLSARIIKYRKLIGGFVSSEQLKEVYGLPAETFERIKSMVYADTTLLRKVNINTADYTALTGIPYLRRFHLTDILKYRELQGRISSVDELVKNRIIPDSLEARIRPYIDF